MPTKQEFQAQARKYLGLPHRHQGRAHLGGKNQALDCIGLLVCASEDLGLVDALGVPIRRADDLNYGPQPTKSDVHAECKRRMITKAEAVQGKPITIAPAPGDIITLLVRYRETEPGVTCHVAIVTSLLGGLGMVHSHAMIGRVVEHSLAPKWEKRIQGIFSIPGLT
jgi:hypothetical protein